MSMTPYSLIFPENNDPFMVLKIPRKMGALTKGSYTFVECYCTEPDCDCRLVTMIVLSDKGREKACINFYFDPVSDTSGPFLEESHKQSAMAGDLLDAFVDMLNSEASWVSRMHERYRLVRKKVDGRPYKGEKFPKPGSVIHVAALPPDLEDVLEELQNDFSDLFLPAGMKTPGKRSSKDGRVLSMSDLLLEYQQAGSNSRLEAHSELQNRLRSRIITKDAADEMACLLVKLFREDSDDEKINAALRMLLDILEILRVELERGRPKSAKRMEALQTALAQRVFVECGEADLCASVTNILLQSRVAILPVLHEANTERMFREVEDPASRFTEGTDFVEGLSRSILEMGIQNPFEGADALVQIASFGNADALAQLFAQLMHSNKPLIRDIAVLMLFHPDSDVGRNLAVHLADVDGSRFSPDSLRRLIVARNWFPEPVRKNIDRIVSTARKSRVECAPLPKNQLMTVYASVIDGAGAQSIQAIIPDGKGYAACSLLLKKGVGLADAFVVPFRNKRELNDYVSMLKNEAGTFIESTMSYTDLRVCEALHEGAVLGNIPNVNLVQVAERLGRDQWRSVPFDCSSSLDRLRQEARGRASDAQFAKDREKALKGSGTWLENHEFLSSWFEDDAALDKLAAKIMESGNIDTEAAILEAIIDKIIRKRRDIWTERAVQTAVWLEMSRPASLPWQSMYHVAEALADPKVSLKDIPLMLAVAANSFGAFLWRMKNDAMR